MMFTFLVVMENGDDRLCLSLAIEKESASEQNAMMFTFPLFCRIKVSGYGIVY